jgi:predicted metalloprotease with PDZ domain
MNRSGHRKAGRQLAEQGQLSGKNMEKQVAADVANSMAFFQEVYGRCSAGKLYATEIPDGHGEAFPGLIDLAWSTFQSTDRYGADDIFRAHEVAHQWWGISVDFKTYHDQWLSEGLSEYSGLWYMQSVRGDNKLFFDQLREWSESVRKNRSYLLGRGQEAGPIWLGYRTGSSQTEGDYDLIIYKKGAWVVHMLRNMLLDLQTMKEDRFIAMMRDFYARYQGRKASTQDFQEVVERHAGVDMQWFFDQWVYGTEIPSYEFAYKVEETPQGTYLVHCQVRQLHVAEAFRMYVPVYVDFGENRHARVRLSVVGPLSRIDLPPLPLKPKTLVLNDLESVLCEVKEGRWQD